MRIDSDAVETRSKLPGSARPAAGPPASSWLHTFKKNLVRPLFFLIMFIINARRVYGNRYPPIRDLRLAPCPLPSTRKTHDALFPVPVPIIDFFSQAETLSFFSFFFYSAVLLESIALETNVIKVWMVSKYCKY